MDNTITFTVNGSFLTHLIDAFGELSLSLNNELAITQSYIAMYDNLIKTLDIQISEMVLKAEDVEKTKNSMPMLSTLADHFKKQAEKPHNSKLKEAKKIAEQYNTISEQFAFMKQFYTFWIETHEAINSPESKFVTYEELKAML